MVAQRERVRHTGTRATQRPLRQYQTTVTDAKRVRGVPSRWHQAVEQPCSVYYVPKSTRLDRSVRRPRL